jgi:hemerythrin-like metal-binding protein
MNLENTGWDGNLSLNHPVIDRQHQEILLRVHELPQRNDPKFDQAIQFLLRYTFDHFRDEEALMLANGYPACQSHMNAHRAIEKTFDQHFNQYLKAAIDYEKFKQFLHIWITQHILQEDRNFADYLAGHRN